MLKVKNGKIEFLRFLFSIIIIIHHSRYLIGNEECMFLGGSFAVEFFFIVSGYLMMASIDKKELFNNSIIDLGKETGIFILKKVKTLYPDVLIAWIIAGVFVSYVKDYSFFSMLKLFLNSIFEVTFINMTGLSIMTLNGVVWYISSMLLCMTILYPLLRKYRDMMVYVVLPLCILLMFGYLCHEYGAPRKPTQWIGITYKGNIRAFAEISLGVICYHIVTKFSNISFSNLGRVALSVLEISCYAIIILYMHYCTA